MEDNEKDGFDASGIIERTGGRNRKLRAYVPPPDNPPQVEPVAGETQSPAPAEPLRQESRRRRGKAEPENYETLFMRAAPTTTRSGKAVYIRKEFHDRIMRIVQNIGYNEVSLFSYIDNVLEHHFNTFQDDISELYRKRRPEDIF